MYKLFVILPAMWGGLGAVAINEESTYVSLGMVLGGFIFSVVAAYRFGIMLQNMKDRIERLEEDYDIRQEKSK